MPISPDRIYQLASVLRKRCHDVKTRSRSASTSGGRTVITIASSFLSSALLTSLLGFVFWAVAARMTSAEVVGGSAAAISAMQLIATVCAFGIPTLLVAELRRSAEAEIKLLVVTSLVIVGISTFSVAGACAVIYRSVSDNGDWMYNTTAGVALFGAGAAINAIAWVLDGALIGVWQSWTHVARNLIFSLVKLGALPIAALSVGLSTSIVYLVWLIGNLVSLAVVALRSKSLGRWVKTRPSLSCLSTVWRSAAGHYGINLALQVSRLAMPIMVAAQLGPAANAAFYAVVLIVGFVWSAPMYLGTGMFSLRKEGGDAFSHGFRTALGLSLAISIIAAVVAPFIAGPVLDLFGSGYQEAAYCLMILISCTFASATKSIYIAVRRAEGELGRAARATAIGSVGELIAVQIGIHMGGLTEIGIALGVALVIEALFFGPLVYRYYLKRG